MKWRNSEQIRRDCLQQARALSPSVWLLFFFFVCVTLPTSKISCSRRKRDFMKSYAAERNSVDLWHIYRSGLQSCRVEMHIKFRSCENSFIKTQSELLAQLNLCAISCHLTASNVLWGDDLVIHGALGCPTLIWNFCFSYMCGPPYGASMQGRQNNFRKIWNIMRSFVWKSLDRVDNLTNSDQNLAISG